VLPSWLSKDFQQRPELKQIRMIALAAETRIWIAVGVTDLRRGFTGLSGMVQTALKENRDYRVLKTFWHG